MLPNDLGYFCWESDVVTPERTWKFSVSDIADSRGITSKLNREIWLDWHDILMQPEEARMHMYPGVSKDVALSIKRMRMTTWQAAIVAFDDMMVDVKAPLNPAEVIDMLKRQQIPRPARVALPTNNPSLVRLLETLGIREEGLHSGEHSAAWSKFAELARQGAILQPKKFSRNS